MIFNTVKEAEKNLETVIMRFIEGKMPRSIVDAVMSLEETVFAKCAEDNR